MLFERMVLENFALTGRIEGMRCRGRSRIMWMSSFRSGISKSGIDLGENEFNLYMGLSCGITWSRTCQNMARKEKGEIYKMSV